MSRRWLSDTGLHVGLTVVVAVSFVGFFVGTGRHPEVAQAATVPSRATGDAPPARGYRELRESQRGADADLSGDLARLTAAAPAAETTDKPGALAERQQHRAYDGAPPTIPHAIRQDAAPECLVCHENGARVRGRVARPMPHVRYTSCTQCHVVENRPMPGEALPDDAAFGPNTFVGLPPAEAGARAWDIAPPVMPHRSEMRERCLACHGPLGRNAMRTPHPERQSCNQCHPPSAALDLRPGLQP